MLEVTGIDTFYSASQALFAMTLNVNAGEVVTLLGRNGMGKTTTINSIAGIVPPRSGRIVFDGRDVTGLPSYKIAKLGMGLAPEGRQVFPNLTVRENLIAAARRRGTDDWTMDKVLAMFPQLAERLSIMGNLLSGGEQQMLAIGRALMTNPKLLLLDEASEGLAPMVRREIWHALERIRDSGLSILVVDKNIADLIALCDRHYIIEKGAVVWSGPSAELKRRNDIQRRYLGV